MTVEKLIINHIVELGRDGLVNVYIGCGCTLGDLRPCDGFQGDCEPAFNLGASPDGGTDFMVPLDHKPTQEEIAAFWKDREFI